MQVLQFISNFPDKAKTVIPIACTSSHSAQNIAFNELGRQAIAADSNWKNGDYSSKDTIPNKGLAVARMAAHITYLSKKGLQEKFGRKLQEREDLKFGFDADFQIESYLRYQGSVFVDRFDANSYLYITRAMDYFDLAKQFNGNLSDAFKLTKAKFFIIPRESGLFKGQPPIIIDAPDGFVFHHVNAYEKDSNIILDSIFYDDFPSVGPDENFRDIDFDKYPEEN